MKRLDLLLWRANNQATPKVLQGQYHLCANNLRQVGTVHSRGVCFGSSRFVCRGRRRRWCCLSWYPWNGLRCRRCNRLWRICLVCSNTYQCHILCRQFDRRNLGIVQRGMPNKYLSNCRMYPNHIHCMSLLLPSLLFYLIYIVGIGWQHCRFLFSHILWGNFYIHRQTYPHHM